MIEHFLSEKNTVPSVYCNHLFYFSSSGRKWIGLSAKLRDIVSLPLFYSAIAYKSQEETDIF